MTILNPTSHNREWGLSFGRYRLGIPTSAIYHVLARYLRYRNNELSTPRVTEIGESMSSIKITIFSKENTSVE